MRRILVIRASALGDVAMTVPVLYSVARQHPDVELYLLTRPFFARLFVDPPANLHLIEADYKGDCRGVRGMWRLMRRLGRYRFTDVADLHNVLRSWVIDAWMLLGGKRVRMVDKGRRSRRRAMRASGESLTPYVERYARVFERLGLPVKLDFTSLFDRDSARLQSLGTGSSPGLAVGIAPFARYANKTYPVEQMEQVVRLLTARGVGVYLFGARGAEAQTLERWQQTIPGCTSLAGKMPIEEELRAMACMDVMVAMDSANHHLASLAGTPVVSVWGSTTPACGFGAYGQSPDRAVALGLPCQPCSTAGAPACPLGHMRCLKDLAPETIVDKVMEVLAQASPEK